MCPDNRQLVCENHIDQRKVSHFKKEIEKVTIVVPKKTTNHSVQINGSNHLQEVTGKPVTPTNVYAIAKVTRNIVQERYSRSDYFSPTYMLYRL